MPISASAVANLMAVAINQLPDELAKDLIDDFLDKAEDKIADTSTPWDDALLLPVINQVRYQLGVEDGDD